MKETVLQPGDDPMWAKRLEWLEGHAPELLATYLHQPGKLKRHLDGITIRAWEAVYSMIEDQGLPKYEAEALALTDIIYPETQPDYEDHPEDEVDRLLPKTDPVSHVAHHRIQSTGNSTRPFYYFSNSFAIRKGTHHA